jgi:hypothetical protein
LLAFVAIPAALPLARRLRSRVTGFLAAWLAPGLLFYVLVYAGWPVYPDGYLLALVPGLAIAAAVVLRELWAIVRDPMLDARLRWMAQAVVLFVVVQPISWVGHWSEALEESRNAEAWTESWRGLEQEFPPNETALLAQYGAPWVELAHPQYLAWFVQLSQGEDGVARAKLQQWQDGSTAVSYFDRVRDDQNGSQHEVPPHIRRIVVVTGHPAELVSFVSGSGVAMQSTVLPGGAQVQWFEASAVHFVEEAVPWTSIGTIPPSPYVGPPGSGPESLWTGWKGLASTLRV